MFSLQRLIQTPHGAGAAASSHASETEWLYFDTTGYTAARGGVLKRGYRFVLRKCAGMNPGRQGTNARATQISRCRSKWALAISSPAVLLLQNKGMHRRQDRQCHEDRV